MEKMGDANLDVKSFNTEVALLLKQALIAAGLIEGEEAAHIAIVLANEDPYGESLWSRDTADIRVQRILTPAEQSAVLLDALHMNPRGYAHDPVIAAAIRLCSRIATGDVEAAKNLWAQEKIRGMIDGSGLEAGLQLERAMRKLGTVQLSDTKFNAEVKYLIDLALVAAGALPASALVKPPAATAAETSETNKEIERLLAAQKARASTPEFKTRELTEAERVAKQVVVTLLCKLRSGLRL
jgi:hypothetical protein